MKSVKPKSLMVTIKGTHLIKGIIAFVCFLMLIFSISGVLTTLNPEYRPSSSSVKSATTNITGDMLYHLIGQENHYFLQGLPDSSQAPVLTQYLFKLSTNINLDDPRSLLGRELPAYSLFDTEIPVAGEGTNYTNMPIESAPPLEILQAEKEALYKIQMKLKEMAMVDQRKPLLIQQEIGMLFMLFFFIIANHFYPIYKG